MVPETVLKIYLGVPQQTAYTHNYRAPWPVLLNKQCKMSFQLVSIYYETQLSYLRGDLYVFFFLWAGMAHIILEVMGY